MIGAYDFCTGGNHEIESILVAAIYMKLRTDFLSWCWGVAVRFFVWLCILVCIFL